MLRKERLEELHISLDSLVVQIEKIHRLSLDETIAIENLNKTTEALFSQTVLLRNQVRDELFKELAKQPKKLPIIA